MKTTTWSEKWLREVCIKWLVKSVGRFSMSQPNHKGFFHVYSSVVSSLGLRWIVVGTTYLGVM